MIRAGSGHVTLGQLAALYEERRSAQTGQRQGWRKGNKPIGAKTLRSHLVCLRYLIEWFGEDRQAEMLEPMEIEDWLDAVHAGELEHVREWTRKKSTPPSEQTMRKYIRDAKAIYNWAIRNKILAANPFEDFSGHPNPSGQKDYISLDDLTALCAEAPNDDWALLWQMCRYTGLRSGEALDAVWSGEGYDRYQYHHATGVDWERHTLSVLPTKTRQFREVPLRPQIYQRLLARFHAAADARQHVLDLSGNNLRRTIHNAARRAGLKKWPKPYQCLRASAESDLNQTGASPATVAYWMGHSEDVARRFYRTPAESEVRIVTGLK